MIVIYMTINQSCAESHAKFKKKYANSIFKNSQFFIEFPFKKNEDVNPTKAMHLGMKPKDKP